MSKDHDAIDERALHERRKRVIGRLFMRAARAFEERAVERIRDLGYEDYRTGDNLVLIHLDTRGNRISELAQRAGVTKQAISKAVRDLEKRGLVTKEQDPDDGRAQIVKLTAEGFDMMVDAFDVVFALDDEFAGHLPENELERMREGMLALLEKLDPDGF